MKLTVPEPLKVLLVDDWEAVTKNNQVRIPPLPPTSISVKTSLDAYSSSACHENPMLLSSSTSSRPMYCHKPAHYSTLPFPPRSISFRISPLTGCTCAYRLKDPKVLMPTIVAGLQTYFDRALGANLLYRFERPQYAEIRKKYVTGPTVQVGQEKEMSAIYGAEHFLRMLGTVLYMDVGREDVD